MNSLAMPVSISAMPRHYIQHVVNAGLGPDGEQRCRRCRELLPMVPGGHPEGWVTLGYEETDGKETLSSIHGLSGPILSTDSYEECIADDGVPAHA